MTDPTFVKPTDIHPLSLSSISKGRQPHAGLNHILPVIPPTSPEVSEGVAELSSMFAHAITPTEIAWAQGKVPSTDLNPEPAPEPKPPKFKNAYHAIIDQMLIDPTVTVTRLSTLTGYSRTWLHKVMSSDSFQAQLASRQKNLVDDHIRHTVMDRLSGLGSRAIEVLEKTMDSDNVPAQFALDVLNMANKAQGIGQQKVNNVQNFIVQVPTPMTNAGEWATQHGGGRLGATVVEPIDIIPDDTLPTEGDSVGIRPELCSPTTSEGADHDA